MISKNNTGKLVSMILITLFLLETLQTPILYSSTPSLGRQDYIFSLNREVNFYDLSDFQFAQWAEIYTSGTALFASDKEAYGLCLAAERIPIQPQGVNVSDTISLLESGISDYVLVLSYLPGYMSFTSDNGTILEFSSADVSSLIGSSHLDRVYDNSRIVNFAEVGK